VKDLAAQVQALAVRVAELEAIIQSLKGKTQ
jgi:hypothetical protein